MEIEEAGAWLQLRVPGCQAADGGHGQQRLQAGAGRRIHLSGTQFNAL